MSQPGGSNCDWCELPIEAAERGVRLSTSQPPWTPRSGYSAVAAMGFAFSNSIRGDKFYALLREGR